MLESIDAEISISLSKLATQHNLVEILGLMENQ